MGATTTISWTERTWNAAIGCSRVSPGCAHCYAERMAATKFRRFTGGTVWGRSNPRYVTSDSLWKAPLKWAREARREGRKIRVFANSLYDFCEDHPDIAAIRPRLWELIDATRDALTYLLLTKRPENLAACLPRNWGPFWSGVWIGTSVESADYVSRADHLRAIDAEVRFLSVEPALSPIAGALDLTGIDWCIYGGESGPGYRPDDPQWARDLLAACRRSGTAFFYKQSSGARSGMNPTLDGVEWKEFPVPRKP
jgi:protein gp37